MGENLKNVRPPRKPLAIQRQVNSLLEIAGEQFDDNFLRSQKAALSGDLPFYSSNITAVNKAEGTQTEGRFFSKGVNPTTMLGSHLEDKYGTRFLEKPLVYASSPTIPVVLHEFTHSALHDIRQATGVKNFSELVKPVDIAGRQMSEEDYIRFMDMKRFPENMYIREEVKDYFTKLRRHKLTEKEFKELEKNPTVLENLTHLGNLALALLQDDEELFFPEE